MFGKKFLNFVALLFVGSQINSAFAVIADLGINDCAGGFDPTTCSDVATSNCKTVDGIIYGVTEENGCAASPYTLVANSVNIVDMSSGLALANLESDISSLVGENKIGIVICGATSCKQTFGYIKTSEDTPKYYRIGADGTNEAVVSGAAVTTVGVLSPDNFKLNIADGNSVDFISGNNDAANYLLPKASASGVFMTSDAVGALTTETHIVIKAVSDTFVFDNVFDDEQFCVLTSSLVMSRIDNFCSGSSFDSLYSCTGGICELSESFVEAGKYIVENNLYVCTGSSPNVVCTKDDGTNDGIHVFQKYDDNNGDTLVKLTEDLTSANLGGSEKYQIFDCESAVCTRTSGYIKYGAGSTSTGRCPNNEDCAAQAGDDATGLTGNAGTLKFTGSAFTYTVEGGSAKVVATGNDYFFVDGDSQYDYISFESTSIVALAKNVENDIYVKKDDSTVGDSGDCVSNTYKHYIIDPSKDATIVDASSADCTAVASACVITDDNTNNCSGYFITTSGTTIHITTASATVGDLYYCETGKCEKKTTLIGYFKNADTVHTEVPYIKCYVDVSAGDSIKCIAIAENSKADCNAAEAGDIIKSSVNSEYYFCVTKAANGGVALTSDSGATALSTLSQYFVGISGLRSQISLAPSASDSKSVLLDLKDGNVVKNVSDSVKYRYTSGTTSEVLSRKASDICAVGSHSYYEYKKTDSINHYYEQSEAKTNVVA